ncbi:MAG: tyrosine-protein phosphatase [Acidimicrobiales bacterium]
MVVSTGAGTMPPSSSPTLVFDGALDLRTDRERSADGVFEHPDIVTVHIPMLEQLEHLADRRSELGGDLMLEFYLGIAASNSGAIALTIAELIASVLDNEPVIFHATLGGKDRTGIIAALAPALAGVDDHLSLRLREVG